VLFFLPFFLGQSLYCCDNILIILPARAFLHEALRQGIYPIWNPTIFSGMPFLADINISPLYPVAIIESLLLSVFSWFTVVNITVLFHACIAFAGMYLCARLLTNNRLSKLTSAVVFVFSGTYITYTNNLPMLYVVSYAPWVVWSVSSALRTGRKSYMLGAVFFTSMQIISGHPQLTFITWLFLLLFIPLIKITGWKTVMVRILGIVGVSLCLTSVQLLPFVELALASTRIGGGLSYASQGAFPLTALIRFIVPVVTGQVSLGTEWWQGGSMYGYMGILVLLILIAGVKFDRARLYLIGIGIISFTASFGTALPVYTLVYYLIPGVSFFRVPSHFIFITLFAVSFLAAKSIESFGQQHQRRMGKIGVVFVLAGAVLTGIYFVIPQIAEYNAEHLHVQKVLYLGQAGMQSIASEVFIFLIIVSLASFIIARVQKRTLSFFIWFCISLELVVFSRNALLTFPSRYLVPFVQKSIVDLVPDHRYFFTSEAYPAGIRKQFASPTLPGEMFYQFSAFRPNIGVLSGKAYVNGYSSLVPQSYQALFQSQTKDPTGVAITIQDNEMLDRLAVTHTISSNGQRTMRFSAFPMYRWLTTSGIVEPLKAQEDRPGYIFFSLPPDTQSVTAAIPRMNGWSAYVDGKKRTIEGPLLTVTVEPNERILLFRYEPVSVFAGMALSAVTTVGLSIWMLLPKKKKAYEQYIQKTTA
jgi:hypothetical protein